MEFGKAKEADVSEISTGKTAFEGARNCRDIGGILSSDGWRVKTGHILRSDSLHSLSVGDIRKLQDICHLSLVIDLRNAVEFEEKPDIQIPNVRYLHVPLFQDSVIGMTRENGVLEAARHVPDMSMLYRLIVSEPYSVSQVSVAIREIMGCTAGSVVFHCTAGKDRTGIITMLLYGLLDVSENMIIEDYLKSNETAVSDAQAHYEMVLEATGDETTAEGIRKAYIADEDYLKSALDYIHSEYGSIQDYCRKALAISDREAEAFRARMLTV